MLAIMYCGKSQSVAAVILLFRCSPQTCPLRCLQGWMASIVELRPSDIYPHSSLFHCLVAHSLSGPC